MADPSTIPPVIAQIGYSKLQFDRHIDWMHLAQPARVTVPSQAVSETTVAD